jgi:hypothetical protein
VKNQNLVFKINRAKWTRGVAQAIKYLLCKSKALSSNPPQSYQNNINEIKVKSKSIQLLKENIREYVSALE